jgi:hypothetical protein
MNHTDLIRHEAAPARRPHPSRVLPVLAFAALFAPPAAAYLDPGTGSLLLQGLIAGIAATVTFLSVYWQRAKALLRSLFGRSAPRDGDDEPGAH